MAEVMDIYARVSQTGGREGKDNFWSPTEQVEKGEALCNVKGWEPGERVLDLDASGGTMDRPKFQALMSRIQTGESRGIIVARLDRLGRTSAGIWRTVEQVREHGGAIVSVQDGVDTTQDTPIANAQLAMLAMMAQWQLDNVKAGWRETHARHVANGVTTSRPWGYDYGADRRLVATREGRVWVPRIFAWRVENVSLMAIARKLNDAGVRRRSGGSWSGQAVQRVIDSRAYLGEVWFGEVANEQAHEALVELPLWLAAQAPSPGRRQAPSGALLTGLVRCAGCRYALCYFSATRSYRCNARAANHKCPNPVTISAAQLDAYVWQWALDRMEAERATITASRPTSPDALAAYEAARATRVLFEEDSADLIRIQGKERYKEILTKLYRDEREAEREVVSEHHGAKPPSLAELEVVDVDERRELLAAALDCVFVRGRPGMGQTLPVASRTLILPTGEGPAREELPRRGRGPVFVPRTFPFPRETEADAGVAAA